MYEMEEGVGFVKKKTSSGCLIIKKKVDGSGGVRASGSRKVFEPNKERERRHLARSESESSEELLEPYRTEVVSGTDKVRKASVVCHGGRVRDSKFGRNGEIWSERKRSLDVSELNDRDCISGKRTRQEDRFKSERKFETGSIRHVNGQKYSHFDRNTSNLSSGTEELNGYSAMSRFEIEDGEAHQPMSSLRQKCQLVSHETIRLQGKNGVLKVMVNQKKKKMEPFHKFYEHPFEFEERKGSRIEPLHKFYEHPFEFEERKVSRHEKDVKNNVVPKPSNSDSRRPEKTISIARTVKNDIKLRKPLSISPGVGNSESDDSDTLLRLGPTSTQACSSLKGIEKNGGKSPLAEKIAPVEGKEGKARRGYGTEKQLLRDKIRSMLVSAGWTIDYRPRRNRDYLDAVYINPNGTAYWSIIKAHEAFQKQLGVEAVDIKPSSQFTPVPEVLLSKLTRRTRKKIENEMKMKQRESCEGVDIEESVKGIDGDKGYEKLSFVRGRSGNSQNGRSHEVTCASGDDSSDTLYKGSPKKEGAEKLFIASNSDIIRGRKCQNIGGRTLLIRSCDKGLNSESDGYVPYMGKRTLLSWLIDSGVVHLSEKVQYMNQRRTKAMLEGWITRDGIHCGCCSKILSVLKFEIHAGSKLRQPFRNIYLESGVSLLQCQIDAWNTQEESRRCGFHTVDKIGDDPSDDTCSLCGDGGDLMCCDGCPATFHQSCLIIKMLPRGHWHCPNCTCKFCGISSETTAPRNGKTVCALQTCSLYHKSCSQEIDALPDDSSCSTTSFCGQECLEWLITTSTDMGTHNVQRIRRCTQQRHFKLKTVVDISLLLFDNLQKLLGVKNELESGFSWSLIHQTDLNTDTSHCSFPQRVECNSKLAVALSVMDECFLPIIDRRSGINLIHKVLYNSGSNFNRLNYSGFYTAILERGDEIISVACIRIHGTQLAELPFIGTRHMYRRQGMCRLLFRAIESVLCSLKVEKLVIPATSEHMHIWNVVFGFNPIEQSHKQEMRSINMLVFPGTDMLQKLLVEQQITDGNVAINSGKKCGLIQHKHHLMPVVAKKSEVDSSPGYDLIVCKDSGSDEMNNNAAPETSNLPFPAIVSDDSVCRKTLHQSVEKLTESYAESKCPTSSDANYGVVDDVHETDPNVSFIVQVSDLVDETSTLGFMHRALRLCSDHRVRSNTKHGRSSIPAGLKRFGNVSFAVICYLLGKVWESYDRKLKLALF
ncbi:hypothetical protein C3L33_12738, partial [Rhododendron williamsianum]